MNTTMKVSKFSKAYASELPTTSTYNLEEMLDCLCSMKARMYDYRHVFNHEDGEPILDLVQDMINDICNELDNRKI